MNEGKPTRWRDCSREKGDVVTVAVEKKYDEKRFMRVVICGVSSEKAFGKQTV
jgi:hypothetical protein